MTFSVMRLIIGGLILVAIEALNSAAERLEQCTPGFREHAGLDTASSAQCRPEMHIVLPDQAESQIGGPRPPTQSLSAELFVNSNLFAEALVQHARAS
jgi:hypothetical protein